MKDYHTIAHYYHRRLQPQPIYIHCALSDLNTKATMTPTPNKPKDDKKNSLSGFNILCESGYNEEEIRSIRSRFHQMRGTEGFVDGGSFNEDDIRLEEEWMEHTGNLLPEGSVQGSPYKEILSGLILGIFLGILCLFWMRESVFTRTHQLGIILGITINMYYSIIHLFY